MKENISYIDRQKEKYYKIGRVKCFTLSDEVVFFNNMDIK